MSFEEFCKAISDVSSEMFLAIMILLQTCMPCSVNFNRYKNNYEKYSAQPSADAAKPEGEIKTIASPRLMSKLSPLNSMNLVQGGLNFNPNSQKVLL